MKYVYRNGKVVEADGPVDRLWVTGVISDNMPAMRHHGTGRIIDSKSKFRADTKASGCVEIGNEIPKARKPISLDKGQRREAIRKTLYDLRNR